MFVPTVYYASFVRNIINFPYSYLLQHFREPIAGIMNCSRIAICALKPLLYGHMAYIVKQ
jgi:hypothetical protein